MVEKSNLLVLALYTAVDYKHGQGAGIGVVQQADGIASGTRVHHQILRQERRYGYRRNDLVIENIKTSRRAKMLALVHALHLAHKTAKRIRSQAIQVSKVIVFSDPTTVVQTIHHHVEHQPESLHRINSTNDRSMIRRVLGGIRKLKRFDLEVDITVPSVEHSVAKRVRTIARQKGSKACRSRCRLKRASSNLLNEQPKEDFGVSDAGWIE